MRKETVRLRTGIEEDIRAMQIAEAMDKPIEFVVFSLYKLAAWFIEHGESGVIKCSDGAIDRVCGVDGMASMLLSVGWMQRHDKKARLAGFISVAGTRRPLNKKVRASMLTNGSCNLCGTTDDLVIDHIIPVCRGGSSKLENLQVLCAACNRMKGRRLMEELLS